MRRSSGIRNPRAARSASSHTPSTPGNAEMCGGSEAGSYFRRIDFVYHSSLGLRVIKKKKYRRCRTWNKYATAMFWPWLELFLDRKSFSPFTLFPPRLPAVRACHSARNTISDWYRVLIPIRTRYAGCCRAESSRARIESS